MADFFLATTADNRTWKSDKPIIFLGEWCCKYNQKKNWENLDAKIALPLNNDLETKLKDIKNLEVIYFSIIKDLTLELNRFHKTSFTERQWKIILGHWLKRYIATIYNRFQTLNSVINQYESLETIVLNINGLQLAKETSLDFIWATNDDLWNHVIYGKILEYIDKVEILRKNVEVHASENKGFITKISYKNKIKKFIIKKLRVFLLFFKKNTDAMIINTYLPFWEEVKLNLSLGQIPQFWFSPDFISQKKFSNRDSNCISLTKKDVQESEKIIRKLLPEIIPKCFIENFDELLKLSSEQAWPLKPKFIFTSNNFDTDEIFKTWVAIKISVHTPYYTGQHGNNYGTHIYDANENWPERDCADKFFTWGWGDESIKNKPMFNFKTAGKKIINYNKSGGLLLIENSIPHQLYSHDVFNEFKNYQNDQYVFFETLDINIQKELTIRLHSSYGKSNGFERQKWMDRFPEASLELGQEKMNSLILKNRLIIHSYDSTGLLECLSLDIPCICFWQNGLDHLNQEVKKYYNELIKANIVFLNPFDAATFINLNWCKIEEWWESDIVIKAKNEFKNKFSVSQENHLQILKKELLNYEGKN